MPRVTKENIKKGMFMTGEGVPVYLDAKQPLCQVYKQQQQQPVSLNEIGARLEALRQKVVALQAKKP